MWQCTNSNGVGWWRIGGVQVVVGLDVVVVEVVVMLWGDGDTGGGRGRVKMGLVNGMGLFVAW